jgi:hypothetical protein
VGVVMWTGYAGPEWAWPKADNNSYLNSSLSVMPDLIRHPGSRVVQNHWIPAFAGMTFEMSLICPLTEGQIKTLWVRLFDLTFGFWHYRTCNRREPLNPGSCDHCTQISIN